MQQKEERLTHAPNQMKQTKKREKGKEQFIHPTHQMKMVCNLHRSHHHPRQI